MSSSGCLPRRFFPLCFFLAKSQHAGVFRHLCRASRRGSNRSTALLALVIVLGPLQHVFGFLNAGARVVFSSSRLGDGNGIARFEQVQRDVRLGLG